MTFDPHFRFYADGRAPLAGLPDEGWWPALRAELAAELERRRARYPALVTKGRMERAVAERELRVWRALAASVGAAPAGSGAGQGSASWAERVHCLRREIALRRQLAPERIAAGRESPDDAAHALALLEQLHDLLWHDAGGRAGEAARAERLRHLEPRAA